MPSPPTIIRVITWLPVGGIERRLVAVLPRLRDNGFAVRLVCIREYGALAGELRDAGIPVDLVQLKSRLDPRGIMALKKHFILHRAQIVHTHMYRSSVPGTIAAHLANVPVVFSQIHNVGTWESRRQAAMDKFLCRWRTGVIAVSGAVRDDAVSKLSLPPDKVHVLYNGVDTEAFQPDLEARDKLRKELKLDSKTAFLVPARLHPQKNPLGVLDAFAKALQEAPNSDSVLLFAGGGTMEEELRAAISEKNMNGSVVILGTRSDMAALYNAVDAIVLSSFKEGFSNAVVEALACGKPVIASDVGGNKEAINSEEVGWIHPAGEMGMLKDQMVAAMKLSASLSKFGGPCRQRALRFSLDRLVEETAELYTNALEQAKQ